MGFTEELLAWFDAGRSDRPWRDRTDPYEIWISEVMLQQTRSETVERYYGRFLARFPDVSELAQAPLDEVLALWSGLGYYRRARQLHQAAGRIVERGGRLPATAAELLELPGIGPYTAAAVASIAYGEPVPVLDGNVERVLARVEAMRENPRTASGRRRLLALAKESLDSTRPGDFNQALMELGATVCTPKTPDCPACPVSASCRGLDEGDPTRYPRLPKRSKPVLEKRLAVVVRDGGRLLMSRRADDARQLAGVWELPWVAASAGDTGVTDALAARYGGRWRIEPATVRVRHSITTRSLDVAVSTGEWEPESTETVAKATGLAWLEEIDLGSVPTTSLVAKALAAVADS